MPGLFLEDHGIIRHRVWSRLWQSGLLWFLNPASQVIELTISLFETPQESSLRPPFMWGDAKSPLWFHE